MKNETFANLLNCEHIGYDTFIDLALQTTYIVEEKIAAEVAGKKGCIIHDGWSHQGTHFVGLMASYMTRPQSGKLECTQNVIRLLQCSTLPNDEDEGKIISLWCIQHSSYLECRQSLCHTNMSSKDWKL